MPLYALCGQPIFVYLLKHKRHLRKYKMILKRITQLYYFSNQHETFDIDFSYGCASEVR